MLLTPCRTCISTVRRPCIQPIHTAMFSSLGLDSRTSTRTARSGASKYFDMPRGLSVHVFKNPTQQAPLPPSYYTASKGQSGQDWSVNDSSRPKFERKASSTPNDPLRIAQPVYVDPKNAKSSRGRAVYPYSSIDTYIYDRSFSTAPDALAASPSSSSSESDIFSESAVSASVDISSTRASSSTETLETTALAIEYPSSASRPSYPRAGASNWSDGTRILPPGLPPVSRSASMSIRANGTLPKPGLVWLPPVDAVSDTEDDTFVDDGDDAGMSQGRPVAFATREDGARDPRYTGSRSALVPMRRPSDERTTTQQLPLQRGGSEAPRGPLGSAKATDNRSPPSSTHGPTPGLIADDARRTHTLSRANTVPMTSASQASRTQDTPVGASLSSVSQPNGAKDRQKPDALAPAMTRSTSASAGALTVAARRAVRWTEDLTCPCPVPRSERRKGWFNRRGDQLWTNDGRFKPSEPGQEYPPDLVGYPEPNTGWMNEEGVRIDMEHCLIPKPPLRSALKRPKVTAGAQ